MARPRIELDFEKLKKLMRMHPSLEDTAAFFECGKTTIEDKIKEEFGITFKEFRRQHMVHTRLSLRQKAIEKAQSGDNTMIIWCMKNLDTWTDKVENKNETEVSLKGEIGVAKVELEERIKLLKDK